MAQKRSVNKAQTGQKRVTVQLPTELIERIRDIVYWTPGLTLNELAEVAFTNTLSCAELLRGEPFPPRRGSIRVGRPVR